MKRLAILILKSSYDEAHFESTLASVLANRPADSVIRVVCPGGYDDPYALGSEVTFVEIDEGLTDARWIRFGLESLPADCDIIHLLASGLEVDEGWTQEPLELLEDVAVDAVVPTIIRSDGRIAAAGIRPGRGGGVKAIGSGRRRLKRKQGESKSWGAALGAAFYRRHILEDTHFADPLFAPWLMDMHIAASLHRAGRQLVRSERHPLRGELRLKPDCSPFLAAQLDERLFWRHQASVGRILAHPLELAYDGIRSVFQGQLLSRGCGRLVGLLYAPVEFARGLKSKPSPPPSPSTLKTPGPSQQSDRPARRPAA